MSSFHEKPNKFINHITLKVENINHSKEFYQKILGFDILSENNKEIILTVDGSTPLITLIQPENIIAKLPRKTGLYHFAILVPSRLDLGLFLKNIRDNKYPLIGGSNHGVSQAIYLENPDNNGIEIYTDTDASTWNWESSNVNMTNKPLDFDGLLDEVGAKSWDGLPLKTIIGHIHLHVADLIQSEKFYKEGLGYNLVSSITNQALFFSSGGYHHHIAINIWNGKGSSPLAENSAGMKHYSIVFPNVEERKRIIDNLNELGYKVMEENDAFFTEDPSGNRIKLVV
jgi:catechol 2,3-dioxygenase